MAPLELAGLKRWPYWADKSTIRSESNPSPASGLGRGADVKHCPLPRTPQTSRNLPPMDRKINDRLMLMVLISGGQLACLLGALVWFTNWLDASLLSRMRQQVLAANEQFASQAV